jgi:hypothetical protein
VQAKLDELENAKREAKKMKCREKAEKSKVSKARLVALYHVHRC